MEVQEADSVQAVECLPVLPLKTSALFPYAFMPLTVGRPASVAAVEAALATEEKVLAVIAQKSPDVEAPTMDDLYGVGTKAVIKRMAQGEGMIQLLVQGTERLAVHQAETEQKYLRVQFRKLVFAAEESTELEALHRAVLDLAQRMLQLAQGERGEMMNQLLASAQDSAHLAFLIASLLQIDVPKEQALLESRTCRELLQRVHGYMQHELQVLELRNKIASKAQTEMSREQRDYMLRQQLKAIQEELGESSATDAEVAELRTRLDKADLPEEARQEADRELNRLERLPPAAPDYQLTRTYLELIAELPWKDSTQDVIDLERAAAILDKDHYGLQEVKERILEHLAVMKLNPDAHSPIICFVGPPGVGKTSLGQSIARALGRKFERLSLGGLHDEAELRGHRRTYIGALPGRIIQALNRSGVNNPLLMLDEVDKVGQDFRGDPSSALLEILDPAQNCSFRDNYLNLPFDLSRVFFITTGNTLDTIPGPLLDRMETIRISGYTVEEKLEIARRYLIPRQFEDAGITLEQLDIPDATLKRIVTHYTREAGVRQLERALGKLARKRAVEVARGQSDPVSIAVSGLPDRLGSERHRPEQSMKHLPPGVATGLAWTGAGGEILFVEASTLPKGRGVKLTGQLGDVMRESAEAAQTYVWAHADRFGIDKDLLGSSGVHIHVPAGAVPKDGPSAGLAIVTALASLYTDTPARGDTAMTGEITLSGRVLPIGGIKEKALAARAAGIRRVVVPKENESDLRDIPDDVREETEFVLVENIDQALRASISGVHQPEAVS